MKNGACHLLPVLLLLALLLTACSVHIEDTNGDDPSPVTLTDEDITDPHATCYKTGYLSNTSSGRTRITCKKLSGVTSVTGIAGGANLTYTASSSAGNIRICVVSASGSIYADLVLDGLSHTLTLPEASGSPAYTLKVAGESAAFSLDYAVNS